MVNFLIVGLITGLVTLVGGGAGYLIWLKSRPKKKHYTAKIYTIAEGKSFKRLKKGGSIKLNELTPYGTDSVEILNRKGITVTRLKGLKKIISSIPPGSVENWGKDEKIVNLIYHKSEIHILKKRFDQENNLLIFDPLPQSRVNMIKTEIIERHNRLKDDKDLLAAVTPWIVAGIIIVGLIAVSWITTEGYIKIANSNRGAAEDNRIAMESAQSTLTEVTSVLMAVSGTPSAKVPEPNDLGPQND